MNKYTINYKDLQQILKPIIMYYEAGGFGECPPRVANALDSLDSMFEVTT
jgi:hypothetical protein